MIATGPGVGQSKFFFRAFSAHAYGAYQASGFARCSGLSALQASKASIETKNMQVSDMELDDKGRLWVCRTDSLIVYDVRGLHLQ